MISFAFSAGHVKSLSSSNRCAALVRRWSSMQATDAAKRRNADVEAAALIVGASRGIGLAISQVLPKRFKGKIFCACRNPDEAGALGALWQFNPERFTILKMDVTVEESVSEAATKLKDMSGGRLDLLINTAGILHDKSTNRMPERNLSQVDADWMIENFKINAVGPALVMKHFTPLMITSRKEGRVFSLLATISARVGSITDNQLGGWYSYRISKAAQNQLSRTSSLELKRRGTAVVALHPGTVNTDLSEPFQGNVRPEKLFPVDTAAVQLLDVLDSLDISDSGKFFDYAREPIEW
uniref:Uncharacterized protein n=2 Tax=Rhodosorus marinus TaxID=101924 RepID=A0A7S3A716_9RHOD|mmetsp:Transcript_43774/g.171259  ORF Transcript_43774/g.171259 Transcript_43774/m.171259 type:complete len:297 (+) Transcript_43774:180-1070(+)|eukprot:CAMPEP_0113963722 /NCGR_PEP_ID=MMETSP0011_2-20120614/6689_1 /TAXON_ID=101924 /ORGANISM="Rhodosorus marinus" /LENGTH=296 /DNA_ID=CAMNT_0000975839 /DNA_START=134 /DNA_END=1024 /DNA_ORIENTATION=- /assembly_acc=CAM_ASM_000156